MILFYDDRVRGSFISSWKTDNAGTSTSTQITIPTVSTGTYGCVVDWGDGTTSSITTYNDAAWTHTYSIAGTYTVKIYGIFKGIQFNNGGDRQKLLNISRWGILQLGNTGNYFFGCSNLTITATDNLNLTGTTTFLQAFRSCSSLTTIPSINTWNTSSITSTANMFSAASNFNQSLSFNTAAVTTMASMFSTCTHFNQSVSFDTVSVTAMNNMFQGCTIFNSAITFTSTAAVTTMQLMFSSCAAFNQSVSSFNTAAVTTFNQMFLNCVAFNQPVPFNTSSATVMNAMFSGCTVFNQSVSTFNTSLVANFGTIFNGCAAFNQDISMWNIASMTSATNMLAGSGFNITNYNKLLDNTTGWPSQATINNNVTFSAGTAHYSAGAPTTGRAILTTTHTWTISDGGTP